MGPAATAQALYSSRKKTALSVTATVGGTAALSALQIRHTALAGVSNVSKMAIIQGEVGTSFNGVQTDFPSRITPEAKAKSAQTVKVYLRFRTISSSGLETTPVTELGPIEGPDPLSFAFQIPPSTIQAGHLQYQIIAQRSSDNATTYFPKTAAADPTGPDAFVDVGVQASALFVFDVNGGRLIIPEGNPNVGHSSIDVPAGLFTSPTTLSLIEIPVDVPTAPSLAAQPQPTVALYRFDSDRLFNGAVKVTLLYPDFIFPQGQRGILNGTQIPETMASVIGWDGFEWRRLGGARDTSLNTLSLRVGNAYRYFAIVPMAALSADDRRPMEKVITPNGDGINDELNFSFGDLTQSVDVDIFDVNGHRVRSLASPNNLKWDGRDDSGKVVESGVYIYQYTVDGKRVSGLVAVAK